METVFASLPCDIRKKILLLTAPLLSVDQRRAAGIAPAKLVVSESFRCKLAAAVNVSRPVTVHLIDDQSTPICPAVGDVLRMGPVFSQYAKTCRVLVAGLTWSPIESDKVSQVVLTGVAPWWYLPPVDETCCTYLQVVGPSK